MKFLVENKEVCNLNETKLKVICNDICLDQLNSDLERRVAWAVMHKYERCFKRLKEEWDRKLAENGVKSVPTDPDEYAALVFAQPNYKDRKTRDLEANQLAGV